jgi:O-antigen ligase
VLTATGSKKGGRNAALFFISFFCLLSIAVFDTGKLFPVRLGVLRLATFGGAVLLFWRRRGLAVEADLYALAVCSFAILSLGHAFSSVYFWVSAQHALNIVQAAILLYWAYLMVRRDPDRAWDGAFLAICAVAAIQLVIALEQRLVDANLRPRGTFDNANFFAEFLAVAGTLCLSRTLGKADDSRLARVASATAALLFIAASLGLSASRAVFIALVPAVAIVLLLRFGMRTGGKYLLVCGVPVLAALGYRMTDRFASPDAYNYARLAIWKSAGKIFLENPFGVGLGGFKYFWFSAQSPIEGAFMRYGKYATTAHNEFLEVLTGMGLVGLMLFVIVLAVPLIRAWKGYRDIEPRKRWVAAGAVGGLTVSGAHALVDFNFHEIGLVVLGAIVLGALLGLLPRNPHRFHLSAPRWLNCVGIAVASVLLAASLATLVGKSAHALGDRRLLRGDVPGAERMFRRAMEVDPFCDSYPDAMGAIGYRLYAMGKKAGDLDPRRAASLLEESIRWEARSIALCPMDFGKTSRLSYLLQELHGVTGRTADLQASIRAAGRALALNPFSADVLWRRAALYDLAGRRREALDDLSRAVSIEPNFCGGYAKLSEMTGSSDPKQASVWKEMENACRRRATVLRVEPFEKWMLEPSEG